MSDILELIDNALSDYTSPDAMRWTPEPRAEVERPPSGYEIWFPEGSERTLPPTQGGWPISVCFRYDAMSSTWSMVERD